MPSIVGEALEAFGTAEQKQRWLVPLLTGKKIAAEALTEPRGGSDFFGTTTEARREGDHYLLRGQKRFIVGAAEADFFLVYARTDPDAPPHQSISAFIVERGAGPAPGGAEGACPVTASTTASTRGGARGGARGGELVEGACPATASTRGGELVEGVEVEYLYGLLGTRGGGTGRLVFRDARVPAGNLVGTENGAGEIFYRMMIPERMTSAAGAIGMGRAALEVAARYSDRRRAFGEKIRRFQAVSFKVADSITLLDAARGLVYSAARSVDAGDDPRRSRRLVSEAKKLATDAAWQVVNHVGTSVAMQIMGGIGYTDVYPIERLLRDTRLIMIWTGANEVMDLIIQHEYYKELLPGRPEVRDVEPDALEAEQVGEKIYE